MHHEMATKIAADDGPIKIFSKQMIAHHANAVAQSKVVMKRMTKKEAAEQGLDYDEYFGVAHDIVVTQNYQICVLMAALPKKTELCYDDCPEECKGSGSIYAPTTRRQLSGSSAKKGGYMPPAKNLLFGSHHQVHCPDYCV